MAKTDITLLLVPERSPLDGSDMPTCTACGTFHTRNSGWTSFHMPSITPTGNSRFAEKVFNYLDHWAAGCHLLHELRQILIMCYHAS